jgi:DNA-binding transcriptional MerR regulator/methylmalonyl-CoA mutase cobalamin-binding subunit
MTERVVDPVLHSSIAAVERATGLSKDTLRVWERRYGFPQPERDTAGDRAYPAEQVERLRVIRRLMDAGHRPGGIVALEMRALQALAAPVVATLKAERNATKAPDLMAFMDLIQCHDAPALRHLLSQAAARSGMVNFVTQLVAPLTAAVGEAWLAGRFQIFEEHIYTESVTRVLRHALSGIPGVSAAGLPRVLLTSFPEEPHALGLLMVETLLTLEGCQCLSLGPQTPIADIAKAAKAHRADIVALSFTSVVGARALTSGLLELRALLPPTTHIWAGGSHPALKQRAMVSGVHVVRSLESLPEQLSLWQQHAHPCG